MSQQSESEELATSIMQDATLQCAKQLEGAYLKLAEVKVLVKQIRFGFREGIPVNLLRNTLLVADGTSSEGLDVFVILEISTPYLQQHK